MKFKGVHTEVKSGVAVHYYRRGKGVRIRLPDDPDSEAFATAVRLAATIGISTPRDKKSTEVENRRLQIGVALKEAVSGAKQRARERGLPFDIDIDWVLSKVEQQDLRCSLTGIPFLSEHNTSSYRHPFAPSLDRIEPKSGYTRENVRIIVFAMNVMLMDWGHTIFEKVVSGYRFTKTKNRLSIPAQHVNVREEAAKLQ